MSAIRVNGVRYAAGLDWLPRGNWLDTAREARKVGSMWCAYDGQQTGYAGASEEYAAGTPVLAAALRGSIDGDSWMALVGSDDGRCAVVQVGEGAILGTGDRVFGSAAEAVEAVEEFAQLGWDLHATPGLVEGAAALDLEALPRKVVLGRIPFHWLTRRLVARSGGLAAALVAGATGWGYREEIAGLWKGVEEDRVAAVEDVPEERLATALDSVALVEGCREALRRFVPEIPGWRRVSLTCRARFAETELIGVRPVFQGRPVMAVRWRAEPGRGEALYRQIAEKQLVSWKEKTGAGLEGLVEGGKAWMAVVLPPVAVVAGGVEAVPRRVLRERLDRRFGVAADEIRHDEQAGSVRIRTAEPLGRIADLLEGLEEFEVVGLAWGREGWVVEGRGIRTVTMPVSKFRALRGSVR